MLRLVIISCAAMIGACSTQPKPPTVDGRNRVAINDGETTSLLSLRAELAEMKQRVRELERRRDVANSVQPLPAKPPSAQTALTSERNTTSLTVEASDQTVRLLLSRWVGILGWRLDWNSAVDYPITNRMKSINTSDPSKALQELKSYLNGVSVPISIEMGDSTIKVASMRFAGNSNRHVTQWNIGNAQTLKQVLSAWTAASGSSLQWESSRDVPITPAARTASYEGSFNSALGKLLSLSEFSQPLGIVPTNNGKTWRVYDIK